MYQILVHPADIERLYKLKSSFNNVASITTTKYYDSYRVINLSDRINVIIPHFNAYLLQSTKMESYYLFNVVTTIMINNNHAIVKGYIEKYYHIKLRKKKDYMLLYLKLKNFHT